VCLAAPETKPRSRSTETKAPANRLLRTHQKPTTGILVESPNRATAGHTADRGGTLSVSVLLRKEVIQPHLPVRLPCYDFVPIADPTFDGSLPYGLGHRLRVLPTFMT
jgi:hypothetical protein